MAIGTWTAKAVWGEVGPHSSEEILADATSQLLEGGITSEEFRQKRRQIVEGRARLDAAVDEAVEGLASAIRRDDS